MRQDLQMTDLQACELQTHGSQTHDLQTHDSLTDERDNRNWAVESSGDIGGAPDGGFSIAEISSSFGVTPRALRFYESRGLLTPYRDGAARQYSDADRSRLALVLKFKALGFTLLEIRALIETQQAASDGAPVLSRAQCVEQINLLERQKRDIDLALSELRRAYSSHYRQILDTKFLDTKFLDTEVLDTKAPGYEGLE